MELQVADTHPFNISDFFSGHVIRIESEIFIHSDHHVQSLALIFQIIGDHILLGNEWTDINSDFFPYFSNGASNSIFSFIDFSLWEPVVFVREVGYYLKLDFQQILKLLSYLTTLLSSPSSE